METPILLTVGIYFILPITLLGLQFLIGGAIERAHLRSLEDREDAHRSFLLTAVKAPPPRSVSTDRPPMLVSGEAVVSSDYFKSWIFGFTNVFGGESKTFTRLFDRARREATQRMVEQAKLLGYDAICNVRYESADIAGNAATNGGRKNPMKIAACTVSGTAYVRA